MKRRQFVKRTALWSGIAWINPGGLLPMPPALPAHIGVQLYSVRDFMSKDVAGTLQKISAMGYREVEGAGYNAGKFYGMPPQEFKQVLQDNGLSMLSAHAMVDVADWDAAKGAVSDRFKQCAEASAQVGQEQIICPFVMPMNRTQDKMLALCEVMNKAAEHCRQYNLRFGYHNHDFEFKPAGEKLLYEWIMERTDPQLVTMQLDLYWVIKAGQDPLHWIAKHPGRFNSFHVKDMAKTEKQETVEVGEGSIDFRPIFAQAGVAGVKYYIVELEHYQRPSIEGVEVALNNLKKLF